MEWQEARNHFGDPFVSGVGVEIGAGLRPVIHPGIDKLYFFDKRDPVEFEAYFGARPTYDLISLDGVKAQYPGGIDFITSHHVIEHIDNPIAVLAEWATLLKTGGVMYLSIPSANNSIERGRLLTPLSHILEDYFFDRPASSYESKQHIYSFIDACTAHGGDLRPWFAENTVEDFSRYRLYDIGARDDHDLHWHTYNLETIRQIVEVAFMVSGCFAEILVAEETSDSHYVAVRKTATGKAPIAFLRFRNTLITAMSMCDRLTAS